MWYKNLSRFFSSFVTIHIDRQTDRRTDRQTDRQTDKRTEFSSLDRVCTACSAVNSIQFLNFILKTNRQTAVSVTNRASMYPVKTEVILNTGISRAMTRVNGLPVPGRLPRAPASSSPVYLTNSAIAGPANTRTQITRPFCDIAGGLSGPHPERSVPASQCATSRADWYHH